MLRRPAGFRLLPSLVVLVLAQPALAQSSGAACENRLGTARTLVLDPAEHSVVTGAERSLGLRNREVVLSFDDGPLPSTRRVLRALERECVRATFFVVGRMAKHHGALLRRIAAAGHTVGHHTYGHERLTAISSSRGGKAIDRGVRAVNRALSGRATSEPRVPFFRSPYLARNARTHRLVRARGMVEVGANIDTRDWQRQSAAQLHDRVMARLRRHGRGIVLMHDIQNRTAAMLPRLLRSMRREGFRVVHLVPPRGERPVVVASAPEATTPEVVATPKGRPGRAPRRLAQARAPSPSMVVLATAEPSLRARRRNLLRRAALRPTLSLRRDLRGRFIIE